MIISDILHFEQERHLLPPAVQRGIEYILSHNLSEAELGRHPLEGDNGDLMFANVQESITCPKQEQKPESHAIYTDIQFLVSGEERLCVYKLQPDVKIVDNKFDSHDIAFYELEAKHLETDIILKPGMYAVFFPSDIHRPNCSVQEQTTNKKIVVKIHSDLLQL
ncbi:YhcH/YjgK/YiaL family protein [Paenibacillus sedimenti]|uniref:YhcH/YjgK/YiaL family protein n=1 Tax=Paenibacillus sedimenti TaxID=2770274 RepID=A0A926QNC6_9BACL|nr:YhcH/YjgK/YiaL family protein [Paenibacillus sedimenti]MBD0384249.1 YhcH/YjgK/YiaL family protein [Paenibacillus sedimenti]